jgi:protein TonB
VAGIIAALAVHGLVLAACILAGPVFVRTETQRMLTVVNVLAEPPKLEELPPLPKFSPPVVYMPVPIVPEIHLAVPLPPLRLQMPPSSRQDRRRPAAAKARTFGERPSRLCGTAVCPPQPLQALSRRHQEGIVFLRFTMDRNGRVLSFDIAKSSGSAALDVEIRELI